MASHLIQSQSFIKIIKYWLTLKDENYTSIHASKHIKSVRNQDLVIGDC